MKTSSRWFGLGAVLLILWAYILTAWLDHKNETNNPAALRKVLIQTAYDKTAQQDKRDAAAQAVCGNAVWYFSDKEELWCKPRRKIKPYIIAKPN